MTLRSILFEETIEKIMPFAVISHLCLLTALCCYMVGVKTEHFFQHLLKTKYELLASPKRAVTAYCEKKNEAKFSASKQKLWHCNLDLYWQDKKNWQNV